MFHGGEKMKKVIQNPRADPDQRQKLISCRGSPLAHACRCLVDVRFRFVSYPAYRTTDRQRDGRTDRRTDGKTDRMNDHYSVGLGRVINCGK